MQPLCSFKFQGKQIQWNDLPQNERDFGPFGLPNDFGTCCYFTPHLHTMKTKDWPLPLAEMFHNYGKLAEYDYPERAKHGESNGLMILLDVEKFNNGYYKAEGTGVKVAVHDHRDLPSMKLDSKLWSPGSYRQVNNLI